MGTSDTYQKTLLKACIIAGDEAALARRLGVPVSTVIDYLLGHRRMPTEVFLRAVDIALADSREHTQEARALIERIRKQRRK